MEIKVCIDGRTVKIDGEFVGLLLSRAWVWMDSGYLSALSEDGTLLLFHHFVLAPLAGYFVHHIDGDTGNNTWENLEYITPEEYDLKIDQLAGCSYFGVDIQNDRFRAYFRLQGRVIIIGQYLTAERAAICFDIAMCKFFPGSLPLNLTVFSAELNFYERYLWTIDKLGFDITDL